MPPHQTARIMRPLAGAFMRANDYSPLLPRGFAPIIRRPGVTPRAIVHRAYSPDRGTPIYSWNHSPRPDHSAPRGFAPIIHRPGVSPRAIIHRAYSPD